MISTASLASQAGTKMTLEGIASLAGVSRSTVSRVINDDPNVRAATRTWVWQVIKANDFHPNTAARALAGRRSRVIGLVIPQALNAIFADPYFPALIQGSAAACDDRGYYLMLSLVLRQSDDTFRWLIRTRHMDGLIVASALTDDSFVAGLLDEHFPFVLIGRKPERTDIITIDADNAHGASMAAQHLAQMGYTRIATITGPANMLAAMDRREGFLCGLQAMGMAAPAAYIQEGDWSEGSGKQAMERLLRATPPPEAVFVASDSMAIGALKAIRAAGLSVPEDIALVGFDDIPLAAIAEPPLTTVHQPIDQLGFLAASTLIDLLETALAKEDDAGVHHIVLPTELVVRASCGQALRCAANRCSRLSADFSEGGVRHTATISTTPIC
jgi:LacI family transcriptional regulator